MAVHPCTAGTSDLIRGSLNRIIIVGDSYDSSVRGSEFYVWRLTSTGELDISFGNGLGYFKAISTVFGESALTSPYAVTTDKSNNILVAATRHYSLLSQNMFVFRLTETGVLDPGFGNHGLYVADSQESLTRSRATSIALDNEERILVSGYQQIIDSGSRFAATLWRLTTDGNLDTGFAEGAGYKSLIQLQDEKASMLMSISRGLVLDEMNNAFMTGKLSTPIRLNLGSSIS